jgi:hypothetical protein
VKPDRNKRLSRKGIHRIDVTPEVLAERAAEALGEAPRVAPGLGGELAVQGAHDGGREVPREGRETSLRPRARACAEGVEVHQAHVGAG